MWQLLGLLLLLVVIGSLADGHLFGRSYRAGGYPVYTSSNSPTGYAVTRRYYDLETGDTYSASTPVAMVAYNTRRPRGSIHYSNGSVPPMGIYPRSY